MPNQTELMIELAKRRLSKDMPKEVASANIGPDTSGWSKNGKNSTLAFTTPFNDIRYKPDRVKDLDQPTIEDLLAHELVHVRQNLEVPLWKKFIDAMVTSADQLPYGQDPSELEAFQVMRDRQMRDHRSPQFANVQFDPSAPVRVNDITLPPEKKK